MLYLIYFFIFIIGAMVGSFLNVIIYRHNTGVSALTGRSFCFSCAHPLAWYDLVPFVSFIALRGKCRYCKTPLSWQYPAVEFIAGTLLLLLALPYVADSVRIGVTDGMTLAYYFTLFSLLLVIAVYDLHHKIIPDRFVYAFAGLSSLSAFGVIGGAEMTVWSLVAGPLLALPLALLWVISGGRWLGLGDAKLVLGMGWLLGMSAGITAVMIGFWLGAAFGLVILGITHIPQLLPQMKAYTMKSEIPFGPFLVLAVFITFFFSLTFSDIQQVLTFSSW